MLFWLSASALSAIVAGAILYPLLRNRRQSLSDGQRTVEFYKIQLGEIESDLERGLISAEEAEQSRREISRRLIKAHEKASHEQPAGQAAQLPTLLAAAFVFVLLVPGAFAVYWQIGRPQLPDMPLADRLAAAESFRLARPTQEEARLGRETWVPPEGLDPEHLRLVQRLRDRLAENSADLEGHRLLVRSELFLGNLRGAVAAQEQVVRILGGKATSTDHSELADLLIAEVGGYVSPDAEQAIDRALALDNGSAVARYFLGLMHVQSGRPDLAVSIWSALMSEGPPDAPWMAQIRDRIPGAARMAGFDLKVEPPALPGPSADDIAAAGELSETERAAMIRSMVEGLRQRLDEEGGTAAEWARLIRSLLVLGDAEGAETALKRAKSAFRGQPEMLAVIAAAAAPAEARN